MSDASRIRHLAAGLCAKGCGRPHRPNRNECAVCAARYAHSTRRSRYKLSAQEYAQIAAVTNCEACSITLTQGRHRTSHAIDHCHKTGAVRGALCIGCNAVLGFVDDDPARLRLIAAYIERWRAQAAA